MAEKVAGLALGAGRDPLDRRIEVEKKELVAAPVREPLREETYRGTGTQISWEADRL